MSRRLEQLFGEVEAVQRGRRRHDGCRSGRRSRRWIRRVKDGVEHVTLDAVARAASVGKGTVFRHFGDRSRLLMALLARAERAYQASFLTGPPPLSAGAPRRPAGGVRRAAWPQSDIR
ncbi:TetR/AcrR family transcriptional regulator [Streptomyces sp. NPDC002740]